MNKNDNDFGLKNIDLNDYKLHKNNSSKIFVFFLILLITYYLYLNFQNSSMIIENNVQLKLNEEINSSNIIDDELIVNYDSNESKVEKISVKKEKDINPTISEINMLSGKYFIITGSFSNYNLSLNKAKILVENGHNAIIIYPINQNNMYRVAVNSYDEIYNAKENLILYKEKLNNELWILRH